MTKTTIIFGAIAGLIITGMMLVSMTIWQDNPNYEMGEVIGYLSMIFGFSTIFFAVKSYRDDQLNGSISFGKAFMTGLYITLIASAIYVVGWEIYFSNYASDFADRYTEHLLEKLREQGASEQEIQREVREIESFKDLYTNPVIRTAMTLMEILPVGIVITLGSAAVLRTKK